MRLFPLVTGDIARTLRQFSLRLRGHRLFGHYGAGTMKPKLNTSVWRSIDSSPRQPLNPDPGAHFSSPLQDVRAKPGMTTCPTPTSLACAVFGPSAIISVAITCSLPSEFSLAASHGAMVPAKGAGKATSVPFVGAKIT
jgi:hypothetical protein